MSPRTLSDSILRDPAVLRTVDTLEHGVRVLLDSDLPALVVLDERGRYRGVFGEREFMTALFPAYLDQLKGAGFLRRSLDAALERRDNCRGERVGDHMNTEHVDVGPDYADTQVAEIFLHHRVLIVPVVDDGRVRGIITRGDFFRSVAERFLQ
jgi:CBS domain-containing protein